MYTDNKRVIKYIQQYGPARIAIPFNETVIPEMDIMLEFKAVLHSLPISPKVPNYGVEWVKAHQDASCSPSDLSDAAHLNIEADQLCRTYLQAHGRVATRNLMQFHLPNSMISLHIDRCTLHTQLELSIRSQATSTPIIQHHCHEKHPFMAAHWVVSSKMHAQQFSDVP